MKLPTRQQILGLSSHRLGREPSLVDCFRTQQRQLPMDHADAANAGDGRLAAAASDVCPRWRTTRNWQSAPYRWWLTLVAEANQKLTANPLSLAVERAALARCGAIVCASRRRGKQDKARSHRPEFHGHVWVRGEDDLMNRYREPFRGWLPDTDNIPRRTGSGNEISYLSLNIYCCIYFL